LRNAYAVRRSVVNAYLVRERDRRRVRELLWVLGAVLPLGLGLITYTYLQLETLRSGYRIESLARREHELANVERQLELEAASLASPKTLSERAATELGLAPPRIDQVLFENELGGTGR